MHVNGHIIVNEPVPFWSLKLSSFEPVQHLDDRLGIPDQFSIQLLLGVGIALVWKISMDSENTLPVEEQPGSSMPKNAKKILTFSSLDYIVQQAV